MNPRHSAHPAGASAIPPRLASAFARTLLATILSLVVMPASPAAETAATGTITGRVLNVATGQYLRNAVVTVKGSALRTVSGSGGAYTLTGVPAGAVELEVNYLGLDPQSLALVVEPGQTMRHDFDLTHADYGTGDVVRLTEFVIATQREGQAKAITEQWEAENMKKVIASDVFGKVPENNVAEFLKLMPGVTTDYVEADARAIRLRGYNPKYTSVTMDGARVAMAGSSTIGTGRTFEFEQLSLSSIETLEVTKTPTPDQPSTAVGTVNLRSKSAFDRAGRRFDYSLSLTGNSRALTLDESYGWDNGDHYKLRPNYAVEYSDVFLGDKLGIIGGSSRSEVYGVQQHIWIGGGGFAYVVDDDPSNNATEIPRAVSMQFQHGLRFTVRTNQNLRFDYHFTPDLSAWVRLDYNTYDNQSLNRNFQMNVPGNKPDGTAGVVNSPGGPVVPGVEYSLRSQTIQGGTWQMTNSGTGRAKWGDTMILDSHLELHRGALLVTAQGQFSRARNSYGSLDQGWFDNTTATSPALNWSWTRQSPDSPSGITYTQLTGPDARDPATYTFNNNGLTAVKRHSEDELWTVRSDVRYTFDLAEVATTLKTGVFTSKNTREVRRQEGMQYTLVGPDGVANSGDGDLAADWVESGFHSDWGWGGNADGLPVLNRFALGRLYYDHPGYFTANTLQHLRTRLQNSWDFRERIDGAYLQAIFAWRRLEFSPGVRFEHTSSWGRGVEDIGDAAARRAVNPDDPASVSTATTAYVEARYGGRLTESSSYGTVLPYLQGTYRLRDDLLFRAAWHEAITRADISNLIPGVSGVNESTFTLNTTNPELRPERSQNLNLSLEYYFEPVGQFTVGWFHSQITDLQRTRTDVPVEDSWLAEAYPGYTLSITENVASSHLSGFELDYAQQLTFLPGHLRGIGVFANYTRLQFDTWDNYPNAARDTGNAGISYTKGRFYGQVRLNYTGKRQTATEPTGWNLFDGERRMVDVSLSWHVNRHATVFLNGRNIFDEPIWGYQGREEAWARYARFGGYWELGVRGTY